MNVSEKKTLGKAIDEMISALEALDVSSRSTAVRAACDHLGITLPQASQGAAFSAGADAGDEAPGSAVAVPHTVVDIRTLKEQKQPSTATEMACLVAYYLDTLPPPSERKRVVSVSDMEKYFKQAGHRLPKYMAQVLVDARAAGYFDSVGRGKYKLNPVGHNLVVHGLPKSKK
jgi:hypothetical protein